MKSSVYELKWKSRKDIQEGRWDADKQPFLEAEEGKIQSVHTYKMCNENVQGNLSEKKQ